MHVIKRDGRKESVSFDKVLERLRKLSYGLETSHVSCESVAQKTIEGIYNGVTTSELDSLASEIAASKAVDHPDYSILASRIIVDNLHKIVEMNFAKNSKLLFDYIDPKTNEHAPLISKEVYDIIQENSSQISGAIINDKDFDFDYFAIKTLEKSYLLKRDGIISETPQQLIMRVSLGIHKNDIKGAIETYQMMSKKYFTHATPTLFNSGTVNPQLSSCFLVAMQDDSIEGIYNTLKQVAQISQYAGGLGVHIHNVRSKGSYIRGTGGRSNGLVPMLKNFNETANYVDQGGGKRKGSFAMYLEPWHGDIFEFLDLKKNTGKDEFRARDLFYAMWVPDLFMERVRDEGVWSLMDPNVCRGLSDVYGQDFKDLYERYEKEGRFIKQVPAQHLWMKIVESQIETGTPYVLYKDAINRRSGQKNLGTIKSSNLCAEIVEYSDKDETAVCNLASIAVCNFIFENKKGKKEFDFEKLFEVSKVVARNIDKVIDVNFYPTKEGEKSNLKHRPMGIGIQGLADALAILKLPFESKEALKLNREIYETIYFGALTASNELSQKNGTYSSFEGSPASEGNLQFDLWDEEAKNMKRDKAIFSKRWDWKKLKEDIKESGLRNSLFIAQMPTASTAQILGNNESFEPFTSNMYLRRTLSGEFITVNKHLLRDLIKLGLWNEDMKNTMMASNGSIQSIDSIPQDIKDIYKTVWEISQKNVIDMAAERGPFVDQSQSMNIHMVGANMAKVSSMHFYGWEKGLKTGMYYLRTQAARDAIKFTVKKTGEVPVEIKEEGDNTEKSVDVINENPKSLEKQEEERKKYGGFTQKEMLDKMKTIDDEDPSMCISCGS